MRVLNAKLPVVTAPDMDAADVPAHDNPLDVTPDGAVQRALSADAFSPLPGNAVALPSEDAAAIAGAIVGAPAQSAARNVLALRIDKETGASLAELIRDAIADRHLSKDEWAVFGSMVNMLPLMAGPECRELLRVFAADHTIDPAVRTEVTSALRARGYPVPTWSQKPIDVEKVVAQNVTEVDARFEQLCLRLGLSDAAQLVAVLDGGFDVTHPTIDKAPALPHADFAESVGGVGGDDPSHGTHVAALATQGTARLAPLCINVLAPSADGRSITLRGFEAAVDHAVAHGARVVNFSVGTTDPAEVEQVERAVRAHPEVLFVLAAGNRPLPLGEGRYAPDIHVASQPFANVCVVTSFNDGRVAGYAAYGGTTALAAEGAALSAAPSARFAFLHGTSMAAPQVTSVAARCKLLDPSLDPVRLQRVLEITVDQHEGLKDVVRSGGALNGTRACSLTALARLVREGSTPAQALETLEIPAPERDLLVLLLRVLDA